MIIWNTIKKKKKSFIKVIWNIRLIIWFLFVYLVFVWCLCSWGVVDVTFDFFDCLKMLLYKYFLLWQGGKKPETTDKKYLNI